MLRKIGRKSEECLFIDDNEENVKGAEKVGIKAIQGENFLQLQEELRKIGIE